MNVDDDEYYNKQYNDFYYIDIEKAIIGKYHIVDGEIDGVLQEKTYLKKIYGNETFSAIQLTTASGVCSVLDMYLNGKIKSTGFVKQESISWKDFIDNPFGSVYI
jgi:saccharopine dehydrogenase-like NADP-dependent oxidoreductase